MTPVAVGLCRCSTDLQDHSVADQEAEIRRWTAERGLELVAVFKDEGVSGSELDRPGLNALRAFLRDSVAKGTVVAWKRDRLVRPEDPLDGLLLEREIRAAGWTLHYLAGTNVVGNLLVDSILGLVEHHAGGEYLRKLAQDSLRGQWRRVLGGDYPGGKIPYGYAKAVVDAQGVVLRTIARGQAHRKAAAERTRLVVGDPFEVETVRWAFGEVERGARLVPLVGALGARQAPSPTGTGWRVATVRDLLTNRVYVGDLVWNRQTSARFFRLVAGQLAAQIATHASRRTGKKTGYQPNAAEHQVVLRDHHPALVERALFDRVQALLLERRRTKEAS